MVKLAFELINSIGQMLQKTRVFCGLFFIMARKENVPRRFHPVRDHGRGNDGQKEGKRNFTSKKHVTEDKPSGNVSDCHESGIELSSGSPVCPKIPMGDRIQDKVGKKGKRNGGYRILCVAGYGAGHQGMRYF